MGCFLPLDFCAYYRAWPLLEL